jgi:hypothetical protein
MESMWKAAMANSGESARRRERWKPDQKAIRRRMATSGEGSGLLHTWDVVSFGDWDIRGLHRGLHVSNISGSGGTSD